MPRDIRALIGLAGVVGLFLALCCLSNRCAQAAADPNAAQADAAPSRVPSTGQVHQALSAIVVPFEANEGQFDARAAFRASTFAGSVFVTTQGQIVHALAAPQETAQSRLSGHKHATATFDKTGWSLVETLAGARPLRVHGDAPSVTHVAQFHGNDPSQWHSAIGTFNQVALGQAWPGIEVALAAHGNNVEKLFTVAPGADPTKIRIKLTGARGVHLDRSGALIASTGNGEVAFSAPLAYQEIQGTRKSIEVNYKLGGDSYGFALGDFDRRAAVVIDPLLQSTYLGGSSYDEVTALAIDGSGNVFVAGVAYSTDFPGTTGGAQPKHGADGGTNDAFVAKLSNDLKTLIQASYLGGNATDVGSAIAVDGSGNVFVSGYTYSNDFPGTSGGVQPAHTADGGKDDIFVVKLNNGLTRILQATYLGGTGYDYPGAMITDGSGNVLVVGATSSTDFPKTKGGAQPSHSADGESDNAFIAKLNNSLTSLTQATYLGGNGSDGAGGIAFDKSGNILIVGSTSSTNFPGTAGGAQTKFGGGNVNGFVTKLNAGLTTLIQSTYLGGSGNGPFGDGSSAIAVDGSGNVFIAGSAESTDFPGTAGGAQPKHAVESIESSGNDAFVAKLNDGLTHLIQASYLGGNDDDYGVAIAVDGSGNVYVAGDTYSTNFPDTTGGPQPTAGGDEDAFVAMFNNDLTAFVQATYLGGGQDDGAAAIVVDGGIDFFVAGFSLSTNFPGTAGGAQQTDAALGSNSTGMIAKLSFAADEIFKNGFENP